MKSCENEVKYQGTFRVIENDVQTLQTQSFRSGLSEDMKQSYWTAYGRKVRKVGSCTNRVVFLLGHDKGHSCCRSCSSVRVVHRNRYLPDSYFSRGCIREAEAVVAEAKRIRVDAETIFE